MTKNKSSDHNPRQDADPFEPSKVAEEGRGKKPKSVNDKGQRIAQNTHNQGYQQDR